MKSCPVIEIRDLTVIREQSVLNGINWTVNPGEHWCILGANGSGKTSLLRTLMAYFAPTSGSIILCGKAYGKYDWRELRKHIGLVSNHLTQRMDRPLSVLNTVLGGSDASLNLSVQHPIKDEIKAMEALDRVSCHHLKERNWLHLSQGEKQRVLIARALMSNLSVLILDEPCAGLDPVARERFLALVQDLLKQPDAPVLILVTHHVEEIVPAITHILLMKDGRVLASGNKKEMLTSEMLSQAFEADIQLISSNPHYQMRITDFP